MAMRRTAISRIARAWAAGDSAALSDGDLMRRFAADGDQAAFAEIVKRHGSMVEGISRRLLPSFQDAEDCCQAVFLLLAKKAGVTRWDASVASWLHETTRKVAHNARISSARRARRESGIRMHQEVSPLDSITGRELLEVLDQELGKLPQRYREPLVLCCLEGLTRDEAAKRLRVPEATLKSQLERGRKKLADALAARGYSLGAALLAIATASAAQSSSRADFTSIVMAASGSPSPSAASLAKKVLLDGALRKIRIALLSLVVIAALGFGVAATQSTSGPPPNAEPNRAAEWPGIADDSPKPAAKDSRQPEPRTVEVSGRVLGPDGKVVGGARLLLPRPKKGRPGAPLDAELTLVATSDDDGRFRFNCSDTGHGLLIARKDGFGVDWATLPRDKPVVDEIRLQLVKEQPISGKVIDLEGKPVAGASVTAAALFVAPNDKLDDYLAGWKKGWRYMDAATARRLFSPINVIEGTTATDKNGEFKLNGAGADRIIDLAIRGRGVATPRVRVITRAGIDLKPFNDAALAQEPVEFRIKGRIPTLYGPEPTIVVEPERIVEGVVKDLVTGKPLAGAEVRPNFETDRSRWTVTDENGKFRLEGLPNDKKYTIEVSARPGGGYLNRTVELQAPSGTSPMTVNVEMARGVVLSGRVVDRQTGKGISAGIGFKPLAGNKNADKPGLQQPWSPADQEGRFRMVVFSGKSLLMVEVHANERFDGKEIGPYLLARPDPDFKELFQYDKRGDTWFINTADDDTEYIDAYHIVKVVELKEDAGEVKVELFAERGRTVKLVVQDADGKPLSGAFVAGLGLMLPAPIQLKTESATIFALDPERRPRLLALLHAEKNLGATVVVRGNEKEPVVVNLSTLGTVTGRLVFDGAPLADAKVSLDFEDRSVWELYRSLEQLRPAATTDMQGRFTLSAVFPGVKFYLAPQKGQSHFMGDPRIGLREVEPGKTLDLGERKMKLKN